MTLDYILIQRYRKDQLARFTTSLRPTFRLIHYITKQSILLVFLTTKHLRSGERSIRCARDKRIEAARGA